MVILMQEITKKIKDEALVKFEPIAIELAKGGKTPKEIATIFKSHVDKKVKEFYQPVGLENFKSIFDRSKIQNEDSKAERIFYSLLAESGLNFNFQVEIGVYRVDYLVNGNLIIELDGPQHIKERDDKRDQYLRGLGYKIIRVPIWILSIDKEAVIQEIIEASRENWNNKKQKTLKNK